MIILLGTQPVWAQNLPLDPLPAKPTPPVQSTNPPAPPTIPNVPAPTPPAPPPSPPPSNLQDAQTLLDTLKNLSDIKTPQQAANAASSLADQLRDVNIPNAINGLDKIIPASTPDDLIKIGNLLGALANGDLWQGLNDAYNELARRYNLPNTSQADKDKLYGQMTKLHDLISGRTLLSDALNRLKNDLLNQLKNAGLSAATKALDDLINGKLKGKDAGDIFNGSDLGKLKDAYAKKAKCEVSPLRNVMSSTMGNGKHSGNHTISVCN